MSNLFGLLPPSASAHAHAVDRLFLSLTLLSALIIASVSFALLYFCIKYRRSAAADNHKPEARSLPLELTWTVIPLLIFLGIFFWSVRLFVGLYSPPADALPVFVVAKQWMWTLQHRNGRREINELHVPTDTPIKLVMTSQDVIHSFFVPELRVKQDVVPGRYTLLWFNIDKPGTYHLYCAEYCGTEHSQMGGVVTALPPAQFSAWLQHGNARSSLAERGFAAYRRYGCSGCHESGASVHAPSLRNLFGTPVQLQDGRRVIADESYLRDSILLPMKDIVAGYATVMPNYSGQMSEDDLMAIIDYLRDEKYRTDEQPESKDAP